MHGRAVVLSLCALLLIPSLPYAADGDLDPSFGGTGVVSVPFAGVSSASGDAGLALLPDGKVLVAAIDPSGLELARYDATGTLDPSFVMASRGPPSLRSPWSR